MREREAKTKKFPSLAVPFSLGHGTVSPPKIENVIKNAADIKHK